MPITFEEIHIDTDRHLRTFLLTIFEAMQFLHQQKIHNINLKPSNIFNNQYGVLKLRDYIGKSFFDLFENGSSVSLNSV